MILTDQGKVSPLPASMKPTILSEIAVKFALGAKAKLANGEMVIEFEGDTLRMHPEDFDIAATAGKKVRSKLPRPNEITATVLLEAHSLAHRYVTEEIFAPGARRVLYYASLSKASAFYRCLLPSLHLNKSAKAISNVSAHRVAREALDYDVVVIQIDHTVATQKFALALREMGKKVVFEFDDAFDELQSWHPQFEQYSRPGEQADMVKMMGIADAVTVPTNHLKERYAQYARRIEVIPNYIPLGDWPKAEPHGTDQFRILWAGSPSHFGDLEVVSKALWRMCESDPSVRLIFFGRTPKGITSEIARSVEVVPYCEFEEYPEKLASLKADVAIAPLADVEFNKGKSNLRLLEYGACGYPTLASPVGPYLETLEGASPESLCATEVDWVTGLRSVQKNPEFADRLKKNAIAISRKYDIADNVGKIEEFFMSL